MKKLLSFLSIAALLLAVSCSDDDDDVPPPPPTTEPTEVTFTSSDGYYEEEGSLGSYSVILRKGQFNNDGEPVGDAFEMGIAFYGDPAADADNAKLLAGIYTPSGSAAKGTYLKGVSAGERSTGTVLFEYKGSAETAYAILSGNIEVSVSGSSYTISGTVADKDSKEFKIQYSGTIVFENENPEPPEEIRWENISFTANESVYFGEITNDFIAGYEVVLRSTETRADGDLELNILFSSPYSIDHENARLAPGTYTPSNTIEDMTFRIGKSEGGDASGTYLTEYQDGGSTDYFMESGNIEVAYSGNTYTITIDLYDQEDNQITATYSGNLEFANEAADDYVVMEFAKAETYGQWYYGTENYFLSFRIYNGDMSTTPLLFTSVNMEVFLPAPSGDLDPSGKYTFSGSDMPYSIIPGELVQEKYLGYTYYNDRDAANEYQDIIFFDGGNILIEKLDGGQYAILANLSGFGFPGEEPRSGKYKYIGELDIEDHSGPEEIDLGEYVISQIQYAGPAYSAYDYPEDVFVMILQTKSTLSTYNQIAIEGYLNPSGGFNNFKLQDGTYNVSADVGDHLISAGEAVESPEKPGNYNIYASYCGKILFGSLNEAYLIYEGTMTVTSSGDEVTMNFQFKGETFTTGRPFIYNTTYTGTPQYVDKSTPAAAPMLAPMKDYRFNARPYAQPLDLRTNPNYMHREVMGR